MSVSTPVGTCWLVLGQVNRSEPIAAVLVEPTSPLREIFERELGTSSTIHPTYPLEQS